MRHTPEPWPIQDEYEGSIPIDSPVSSTGYDESMEICRVSKQIDEAQANARLIASAPDLLEACKAAYEAIGDMTLNEANKPLSNARLLTIIYASERLLGAILKAEEK